MSLRYKNFFVSGSYYAETTFDFPRTPGSVIAVAVDSSGNIIDTAATEVDLSAKRSEWDVSLGYYLNPYVGLTVGYKHMNQDVTTTSSLIDASGQVIARGSPSTTEFDISGPTLGLVGSVPVVNRFGVYGSFGYGFLQTSTEGAPDQDSPYYVVEGGISYSYAPEGGLGAVRALTGYAGYRIQTWTTQNATSDGREGNDTTQGFVVGLNMSF